MNNEEKILSMLERMDERMDRQDQALEEHGGLKSDMTKVKSDVSDLRDDMTEVRVILENKIEPDLQKLAEGHLTLLQTMAPAERVRALEEEFLFRDKAEEIVGMLKSGKSR